MKFLLSILGRFWKGVLRIFGIVRLTANYQTIVMDNSHLVDALVESDELIFSREEIEKMVENPDDDFRAYLCKFITKLANGGDLRTDVAHYHNLVPSVLRDALATLISGTTVTPTFKANYFALGSGSNAPANSDLTLQTETKRAAFTDRSSYTNIAYLDVFFNAAEVGGSTFNEAGIFVDGSGSANTGYLLSRVAINQTLGSSQTLTVNCSITIS